MSYQQQQYYDPYYNGSTQYAQQYYYGPNQPNPSEPYPSRPQTQSPYHPQYVNGAPQAHVPPPTGYPSHPRHSASPHHNPYNPSPHSHIMANPTRSHTPPTIHHLQADNYPTPKTQSPDYARRSRSRSNNPAAHTSPMQQHVSPVHRRSDTTQSQPLYNRPPQNKRRTTTERTTRPEVTRRRNSQEPKQPASNDKAQINHWKYPPRKQNVPSPYGTSSRQEKPRNGRSASSPPTTTLSGEAVKNAYGKRTPNTWALNGDVKISEPKTQLSPVFEEKQRTKNLGKRVEDLISDFNDEEDDDIVANSVVMADIHAPQMFEGLTDTSQNVSENEDPDTDSESLGKGAPPVPHKTNNFPKPTEAIQSNENPHDAEAASAISSLENAQIDLDETMNMQFTRQYQHAVREHGMHHPEPIPIRNSPSPNKDAGRRYDPGIYNTPQNVPPRDNDGAESVTTHTLSSSQPPQSRRRSTSKDMQQWADNRRGSTTSASDGGRHPDQFGNVLRDMAMEDEDRVNKVYQTLQNEEAGHSSPRMSLGGMEMPTDDEEPVGDDDSYPFGNEFHLSEEDSDDDSKSGSSSKHGVGGLVNRAFEDEDNNKKKKRRGPLMTDYQANIFIASLMAALGAALVGTTQGTPNSLHVWLTICIVGSLMFISSTIAIIFMCTGYWSFEQFKIPYSQLKQVEYSDEIRTEIEAQSRKRKQKYKDHQKKLKEERQQIAQERALVSFYHKFLDDFDKNQI